MAESSHTAGAPASSRVFYSAGDGAVGQLANALALELARRWQTGERPLVEELIAPHPELLDHPEAIMHVICEEVCLRQELGEGTRLSDLERRFPQFRAQLKVMLDCQLLLEAGTPPVFPEPGEHWFAFQIVKLLGKGLTGRVYLARQLELADRLMVLKVSPLGGQEHWSLARLRHNYIVPLYQVLTDPERKLQALCMPYLGGVSLDRLLLGLRSIPMSQRQGRDLLALLDQDAPPPRPGVQRAFLTQATYVEAICWIGACLAEGLQYAHDHDLVHLDLKPSNVLLAADGQPMLLDFHLAVKPLAAGEAAPAWFGGTRGYMSPEQREAMPAVQQGQAIPRAVGPATDVYSLGVLLHECLADQLPGDAPADLRQINPAVSTGLADVIGRCLRPEAGERYPSAAELAADLRRHLTHQPLRGVSNRSGWERLSKWQRRRPQALWAAAALGIVLAAAAAAGYSTWERRQGRILQAQAALADGQELLAKGQDVEAQKILSQGLELVQDGPADLVASLQAGLQQARRVQLRHELQRLTDEILFVYDNESLPPPALRKLSDACRTLWQSRAELGEVPGGSGSHFDLAILWADLLVRARPHQASARQEALRILAEAERQFGPNIVLYVERQRHAEAIGETELAVQAAEQAAGLTPRTAWEFYALGRGQLRAGNLMAAAEHLDKAVALEPRGFWPNFYQGVCAYRQGRPADAIAAFRACITLVPDKAECYFNRALAHQALGDASAAIRDYDQALRLDPGLAAAWLNRGVLHYRGQRLEQAASDLRQALQLGSDPALVHYNLALVFQSSSRSQALNHVRLALKARPGFVEARELEERLLAM